MTWRSACACPTPGSTAAPSWTPSRAADDHDRDGEAVVAQGLADVTSGQTAAFEPHPTGRRPRRPHRVRRLRPRRRGARHPRVGLRAGRDPARAPALEPVRPRPEADRVHLAVAAGVAADPAGRRHLRRRLAGRGDDGRRPPPAPRAGRRGRSAEGAALTWVVDPELVAAAEDMANGYRVRGRRRLGGPGRGLGGRRLLARERAGRHRRPAGRRPALRRRRRSARSPGPTSRATSRPPWTWSVETLHRVLPSAGRPRRHRVAGRRLRQPGRRSPRCVRADTTTVVLDGRAVPAGRST